VPKPSFLRELTLRCRALLEMATGPGTIEQLRLWVIELQDQSDRAGARRGGRSRHQAPQGSIWRTPVLFASFCIPAVDRPARSGPAFNAAIWRGPIARAYYIPPPPPPPSPPLSRGWSPLLSGEEGAYGTCPCPVATWAHPPR
jgi:hypothetical protein